MIEKPQLPKTSLEPQLRPRLGQINYINSLPITLPISRGIVGVEADVHLGTPQELNRGYAENRLELGAMSAFFYLQSDGLNLLGDLSISSCGPVGSVLFFLKTEPDRSKTMRIAASSASLTSVNLLFILLKEEFKIEPSFTHCPSPDLTAQEFDGALVIGDYALAVDAHWSKLARRFDLGEWWMSRFHLPMVFAVWAARSQWQRQHNLECSIISESLKRSLAIGLNSGFDQVVAEAVNLSGLSAQRLEHYFRAELDFSFTSDHLAGLNRYKSLCERHGLFAPSLLDRQPYGMPIA